MFRFQLLLALLSFAVAASAGESFRALEWSDLMTLEDRQKMAALPEIEHLGEEVLLTPGEANINSLDYVNSLDDDSSLESDNPLDVQQGLIGGLLSGQAPDAKQQWREVLTATATVSELNNQKVRIAGFIVPLEFDDNMIVTEFFLVPYFGACIHVPPPPPNQLIFVTMEKGIELDAIYDPFWVSGTLATQGKLNDTGYAAYSMAAEKVDDYSESE